MSFDNVLTLAEDDPRLVGRRAWEAHPQAGLGVYKYTPAGVPVMAVAVPHLPTQEFITVLNLAAPGEVGALQLLMMVIAVESGQGSEDLTQLLSDVQAIDMTFMAISALTINQLHP